MNSTLLPPPPADPAAPAAQFTDGLVEVFSDLADLFGNPRSVGAIYGLLFSSEDTLTMDGISQRLDISKGSVSQGLRTLEDYGAIERHVQDGERTARYSAKHQLKPLIAGFVRQRLLPRLEASSARLETLQTVLDTMPAAQAKEAAWRLERVTQWHNKASTFLPLARKILGGG